MNHIFDVDVAKQYGVLEAVMLNNFAFWIAKNKANGAHFHDGKYWTYNTVSAFEELYPYATKKQIRSALDKLREEGLIETGNFNENKYDRTLWYTLTDKGISICRMGHMDLPCGANGDAREGKPIPYINTDLNTSINPYTISSTEGGSEKPKKTISFLVSLFSDEFEEVWKMYPKKQGKSEALKAYAKARNEGTSKEEIMESLKKYVAYTQGRETKYIKNGSTWFNQKCWEDKYEEETGMATHGFDYAKLEELANRKSLGL